MMMEGKRRRRRRRKRESLGEKSGEEELKDTGR